MACEHIQYYCAWLKMKLFTKYNSFATYMYAYFQSLDVAIGKYAEINEI